MRAPGIVGFLVILACFALLFGANLDVSPGLHGDEAWFGIRAQEILAGTDNSLHGMTAHSGALFPLIAAGSFALFGTSILSLRIPGVVCNVLAIGLLAWQVWRLRQRSASAFVLLLLLASSVLVTAESRLGWEVTALGPLLAALLLTLALRVLRENAPTRTSWLDATGVLAVATLGVYSHLIFLALVAGLFVASLTCAVRLREYGTRSLLLVAAVALANSAALAQVKMWLFEAKQSGAAFALLYPLSVVVFAAVFPALRRRLDDALRKVLERVGPQLGKLGPFAAVVGAVAFAAIHGMPFVLTIANDVVLTRVYSVSMPWPLAGLSYGYALLLIGAYVTALVRLTRRPSPAGPAELLLVVLPVPVAATLALLAHPRSIRVLHPPQPRAPGGAGLVARARAPLASHAAAVDRARLRRRGQRHVDSEHRRPAPLRVGLAPVVLVRPAAGYLCSFLPDGAGGAADARRRRARLRHAGGRLHRAAAAVPALDRELGGLVWQEGRRGVRLRPAWRDSIPADRRACAGGAVIASSSRRQNIGTTCE